MAEKLQQHLAKIRSPLGGEKVYKDECAYSFDTPECETGLYICMSTFLGFGKRQVERYYRRTGNAVYLHMWRIKKELPKPEDDPPKKKPTKMAIGVEGGFDLDVPRYEYEEENSVVILPDWTVLSLENPELPGEIQISVASILAADSAAKAEEAAALAGTWDGEKRVVSKHAENLAQQNAGKKIPPKGWKCENCDKTDNLWLNLTDGSILCGRKFWDGTGGNNHALEHYEQVKHPLAVKLGTITPDGADVFSYDEDDMVEDPHLAKHLQHWGINISAMQKTEKTMAELEIDINQKIGEWDIIQEAGSKLEPVYGPGYTGMRNLGNSCYMNSVMQVIFTIPDFKEKFVNPAEEIMTAGPVNPTGDFNCQMAKLGVGLLSGDYSKPPPPDGASGDKDVIRYQEGIRPQMFKTLIGRGHPEFSTKRQQDVQEFLLHLFTVIERNSVGLSNPVDSLKFEVEERVECGASRKLRYTRRSDTILALPIPMDAATNKEEVAAYEQKKKELEEQKKFIDPREIKRPRIPLAACIEAFAAAEVIDDFYSTAVNKKSVAQKTTRLASFPDYLMIQLKKFTIGDDWVPKKLDVSVDIPHELDISSLRGRGLQPGEEELPEAQPQQPEVHIDAAIVAQLVEMGFAYEGCRKAVYHTQSSGIEPAMNWVMENMGNPDFEQPLVLPSGQAKASAPFVPNEDAVGMIQGMGFNRDQAIKALKATDNNLERAADWIFSHAHELETPMDTDQPAPQAEPQAAAGQYCDGSGKYQLVAFISHMGTSTMVGHYVCHILRDGRWVIYNDEKVALSEHPPKDLAYLYLYKRV